MARRMTAQASLHVAGQALVCDEGLSQSATVSSSDHCRNVASIQPHAISSAIESHNCPTFLTAIPSLSVDGIMVKSGRTA